MAATIYALRDWYRLVTCGLFVELSFEHPLFIALIIFALCDEANYNSVLSSEDD